MDGYNGYKNNRADMDLNSECEHGIKMRVWY